MQREQCVDCGNERTLAYDTKQCHECEQAERDYWTSELEEIFSVQGENCMPKNTTIRFYNHNSPVHILQNGLVLDQMSIAKFCELDGALRDTLAEAMDNPGMDIPVPAVSHARGQRPRNYGAYGVAQ